MKNQRAYDAGSSQDVGGKVKGVKLRRLEEAEQLRNLLAGYQGRAVLWRFLDQCGVYRISFAGEVYDTVFKEGQRQIGLWLLAEIHSVAPNAFSQMQQEAVKRTQRS